MDRGSTLHGARNIFCNSPIDLKWSQEVNVKMHLDALVEIEDCFGHGKYFIHPVKKHFLAVIGQVEVEEAIMDSGVQKFRRL